MSVPDKLQPCRHRRSTAVQFSKRQHQQRLLGAWVKKLSSLLLPEAKAFSLDVHPIPYRGEQAVLENHCISCRGQAGPSIQAYFAQKHKNQVFCYANANLTRDEQLKGFEKAKPKQLSRKFVETSGEIELLPNRTIRITFDRRCHNPILRESSTAVIIILWPTQVEF